MATAFPSNEESAMFFLVPEKCVNNFLSSGDSKISVDCLIQQHFLSKLFFPKRKKSQNQSSKISHGCERWELFICEGELSGASSNYS